MGKGKPRRRNKAGSAKRNGVMRPGAKVHNLTPRIWLRNICGDVTRVGGQLIEIPKNA